MPREQEHVTSNFVSTHRERGPRIDGPWTYYNDTTSVGYANGSKTFVAKDDVHRTPPGKERKPLPYWANGTTAAVGYFDLVTREIGAGFWFRKTSTGGWGHMVPPPFSGDPLIKPTDKLERRIAMLKRIGDRKWELGESLVEARDSVSTIASAAKRLQSALLAASRKDWLSVARILGVAPIKLGKLADNVSNAWLAYHFAWKPLVSDMSQAMIYLSGIDDRQDLRVSASSHIERTAYKSYSYGPYTGTQTFVSITAHGRNEVKEWWKARVTYEIRISSLRKLQEYGLGGLSLPWAALPGSYILDWLIPIGDYLAAIDATAGLTFHSGFETTFRKSSLHDLVLYPKQPASNQRLDRFSADTVGKGTRFEMSRVYWQGLDRPPFYLKDPLDLWKATTALALVKTNAYGVRASMNR